MNEIIEWFRQLLDINNIALNWFDYPMSWVELIGTVLNLGCVYLASRARTLNWPVGIIGSVFYIALFYQLRLYSDLGEQIYFVLTGFWGWWLWSWGVKKDEAGEVGYDTPRHNFMSLVAVIVGSLLLARFMGNVHLYLPALFPQPADYPFWDAFTTVMSFVATILMARKRIECWYLWILVDIIGIWLYWTKGVKFISLEYVIFLVLATRGLFDWKGQLESLNKKYGR